MKRRICVAGDGAWGRALAFAAREAGHDTRMWSRRAPDDAALSDAEVIVGAVPAQSVREVVTRLAFKEGTPLIIAAKGIERETGKLMSDVVRDVRPDAPCLALSGPSFAEDVVKGLPTAVVLAGNEELAEEWASALARPQFRIYRSGDLTGVEYGGALKNVLAIACGISDGRGFGESARAALITRGFAELERMGRALGAKPETLRGLSGFGDLILTCTSGKSRNHAFGLAIGGGVGVGAALAASKGVVEGAYTAGIAHRKARGLGIDMPIVAAIRAIVDDGSDPETEIEKLLARRAGLEDE
ncbi:MAG: NAD(P)-dependent glycerol-3-phosphate dehydrogenase [Rhizobiales bacterium]|nr:NAD(P)-dependent glycerol-3-phosphate dehydrogenase [Hyphomicrobiales bacterium]